MSFIQSLDPRVNQRSVPNAFSDQYVAEPLEHFETYEVFHQKKSGDRHQHVGSVHAPSADLAMIFAKEQYARRFETVNLWVVRTADIAALALGDADMFETAKEKEYRNAEIWKVRDKISRFKQEQQSASSAE
jgi:ring-1,2-phenylacetyl-CoA epoxidase subunit PaaB